MQSELKRPPTSFRRALKGRVLVFANTDGRPATKDQNAIVAFLADNSAWNVCWKDGIRGNPYRFGEEAFVQPGDMLMVFVAEDDDEDDPLVIRFPRATALTAGQEIRLVNLVDKKALGPSSPLIFPAQGDRIGRGAVDEPVNVDETFFLGVLTFVSDGNGHWSNSTVLGGNLFIGPL